MSVKEVLLPASTKDNHNEESVVVEKMSAETAKENQLSVNKIPLRDADKHSGNDNNNDKKESDPHVEKE